MRHTSSPSGTTTPFWRSKPGIVLGMLAVIALFYLAREHYTHAAGLLPYLILLLCPLMHLFGHHHGSHSHHATERKDSDEQEK